MSATLIFTQSRQGDPRREPPRPRDLPRTQTATFDYVLSPNNLTELASRAPAIVHVVVTELLNTYYWPGTDVRPDPGSLIVTDIQVVVRDSIKGPFVEGDSLVVLAFQGTLDGVTQVVIDPRTPYIKVGESYILFLQETGVPADQLPQYGIPRFSIFHHWMGRFLVEGGLIKPSNPESKFHQQFKDRPAREFVQTILEGLAGQAR